MAEREQDSLTEEFLHNLMENHTENELRIELENKPQVEGDESLSNLANRVVEQARSHTAAASSVLNSIGVDTRKATGVPKRVGGHLRHVGERARKLSISQNSETQRRVRRVKRAQKRPALGMERMPRPKARKIQR